MKRRNLRESLILEEDFKGIIIAHLIIVRDRQILEMRLSNSRFHLIQVLEQLIMKNYCNYNIMQQFSLGSIQIDTFMKANKYSI